MLWAGERREVKELKENMAAYFNVLQGFLLLSHGNKVGAGPTLSSLIYASVKQVVDCSFMLFKESVSSYGSSNKDPKLSIPPLVGTVWDACSALKKTPATNITAIGRTMTQVAVSMKDVLREMKELKPASSEPNDEASEEASVKAETDPHDSGNSSEGDWGNDLSPEEMKIAQSAIRVVSETLSVIKELIRSITGLIKHENPDNSNGFVNSLERLLKLCQGIGLQVDELGASLYPPQEFPAIKASVEKISSIIDELQAEIDNLKGSSEEFCQACAALRGSLKQIESELGCFSAAHLLPEMQNLVVSN
ncbi:Cyclin-D1-binding protein [Actinidia chinensis var. chinensis]|uniref:Cyclin-D1-binding protein n=1 Tax=Actinidia chinensis var. chinensis TaxID=1590841 RepID=A0A2R6P3V7_ACTCC|nr:Cyclin-D1-binding protein [Actinidia chinensis var. chinensis]